MYRRARTWLVRRVRVDALRGRDHLGVRFRQRLFADREIAVERHLDPFFIFQPRAVVRGPDRVRSGRVGLPARGEVAGEPFRGGNRGCGRAPEARAGRRIADARERLRHRLREQLHAAVRVVDGDRRRVRVDGGQVRARLREQPRDLLLARDHVAQPDCGRGELARDQQKDRAAGGLDVAVGLMPPLLHRLVQQQIVAQRVLEHPPVEPAARRHRGGIDRRQPVEVAMVARQLRGVVGRRVGAELRVVGVNPGRRRRDRIRPERLREIRMRQGRIAGIGAGRAAARLLGRYRRGGEQRRQCDESEPARKLKHPSAFPETFPAPRRSRVRILS